MRHTSAILLLVCAIVIISVSSASGAPRFVSGEILVKFKPGAPVSAKSELHRRNGSNVIGAEYQISVARVTAPKGAEISHARRYGQSRWVEYAEPNYVAQTCETVPSDPYFATSQTHLRKIQASAAWDYARGDDSITVAVVDTGVDYTHPDLGPRVIAGYDFYNGDSDPMDDNGHGTCVAGIIGACTDNDAGVAAVTWQTRIMPVKVASESGSASYLNIAKGIIYATDNGARVVNVSMAGSAYSSAINDAVNYAYQRGCLVLAASGNSGASYVYYPAACENALAVGASDGYDERTSYSNYGSQLDVLAPGWGYTPLRGGGYGMFGGTSAASPHAVGIAALLLSVNPALSPAQVADIIKGTADDLGSTSWDQYTGWGRVNAYSAVIATPESGDELRMPEPVPDTQAPSVQITTPSGGATVSGGLTIAVSVSDNYGVTSVDFYVDGVHIGGGSGTSVQWDSRAVPNGAHIFTATARDAAGNEGVSPPVTVNVSNSISYTQVFTGMAMARKAPVTHSWTATTQVRVSARLSWSAKPGLELSVADSGGVVLTRKSAATSPITLDLGTLAAGNYSFAVAALSDKVKYELVVTATSP